jgi:carbon storage regulator
MLVLARKLGQEIVIDENITLKVLSVKGGTVRLGIEAPQSVPVERGELKDRREREFGSRFDLSDSRQLDAVG